jgi:hypothetical protein
MVFVASSDRASTARWVVHLGRYGNRCCLRGLDPRNQSQTAGLNAWFFRRFHVGGKLLVAIGTRDRDLEARRESGVVATCPWILLGGAIL